MSKTYLNSSYSPDDDTLEISGNNLVRSDHPFSSNQGGVYIYYKNYLPFRIISISFPRQNQDDFRAIIDNLEINLETLPQNVSS